LSRFQKLCREAGLLGGGFSATSADLLFTRLKGKVRGGGLVGGEGRWQQPGCVWGAPARGNKPAECFWVWVIHPPPCCCMRVICVPPHNPTLFLLGLC
jgi:hypothetical protein